MRPARQRLKTRQLPVPFCERLKIKLKLPAHQRMIEVAADLLQSIFVLRHVGGEYGTLISTARLGDIHGPIGSFLQSRQIPAVLGEKADSNARAQEEFMAFHVKGCGES